MNNTFSLQQRSQASSLYSSLVTRQHKLDLMAKFLEKKIYQPKIETIRKSKRIKFLE